MPGYSVSCAHREAVHGASLRPFFCFRIKDLFKPVSANVPVGPASIGCGNAVSQLLIIETGETY